MQYLSDDQVGRLMESIRDSTISGALRWEERDSSYEFLARSEKFVYVVQSVDHDDAHPYRIDFYGQAGARITSIESGDLLRESELSVMQQIYEAAKKQTLGFEDLFSEVVSDLASLPSEAPF